MVEILDIIIFSALVVFNYTFLYKDNPLFKFAEHLFVGVAAAQVAIGGWVSAVRTSWTPMFAAVPAYDGIVPIILGILLFTIFLPKVWYIYRIPMGILVGLGIGIAFVPNIQQLILVQTVDTFVALRGDPLTIFNGIILLIGVITTMLYFVFTIEPKKYAPLRYSAQIGRYFLMASFGAAFVTTVSGRLAGAYYAMGTILDPQHVIVTAIIVVLSALFLVLNSNTGIGKTVTETLQKRRSTTKEPN